MSAAEQTVLTERTPYNEETFLKATEYCKHHSHADLARKVDRTASLISRYLSRDLPNPRPLEEALDAYFARAARFASEEGFVWTESAKLIVSDCVFARDYRKLVPICARAGTGKTNACREFLRRYMNKGDGLFAWVSCLPAMSTRGLARTLLATLRNKKFSEIRGETLGLINDIVLELKFAPQLLVIDDATYLSDRSLQNLIHIYNESGSGMILMGTPSLMERLMHPTGRRAEELEQLTSRFGIEAHTYPRSLSAEDSARVAKAKREEMTPAQLAIVTAQPRTARQVAQLLDRAKFLHGCNKGVNYTEILKVAESELFRQSA